MEFPQDQSKDVGESGTPTQDVPAIMQNSGDSDQASQLKDDPIQHDDELIPVHGPDGQRLIPRKHWPVLKLPDKPAVDVVPQTIVAGNRVDAAFHEPGSIHSDRRSGTTAGQRGSVVGSLAADPNEYAISQRKKEEIPGLQSQSTGVPSSAISVLPLMGAPAAGRKTPRASSEPLVNKVIVRGRTDIGASSMTPGVPAGDASEQLFQYTTKSVVPAESKEAVWISSAYPTQITIKFKDIQKTVELEGHMNTDCLNLAIRKMAREESSDRNSSSRGCKHYVSADFARYAISKEDDDTNLKTCIVNEFADLHSASKAEVICIPVTHEGHWALYAFHMNDEVLSILDPLPNPVRHKDIRLKVCRALELANDKSNLLKNRFGDFSSWKHEVVTVPQQGNSYDSGFFVFNFIRQWDGHHLDPSVIPTDSTMLRKEFLAYILSFKDNEALQLPSGVSELIKRLPSGPALTRRHMGNRLLNIVRDGSIEKFEELEANQGTPGNEIPLESIIFQGVTSDGNGVLHIAARLGHIQLVEAIFRKLNMLPVPRSRSDGSIESKGKGYSESTVHKTPENRITIEASDAVLFATFLTMRNHSGQTCLHEAVKSGHVKLVKLLISVDANVRHDNRTDPAMEQIVRLSQLVDYQGISPLYLATTLGRLIIVQKLTENSSPSFAGPGGKTALHAAVFFNLDLSKYLAGKEDLICKEDNSGTTPLHLMASGGAAYAAKLLLLKFHADHSDSNSPCFLLKKDSKGSLPIHIAAAIGHLDIIKELLSACPDCMSSRNASGQTFLHVAVINTMLNVVKYVRKQKSLAVILNLQDHDGNTALHLAVKSGNQRMFCTLMHNKKLHLSLENKEGYTPRDLAYMSIPAVLNLLQNSRMLIHIHLILVGANIGTYGRDQVSAEWNEKIDKDKISEGITKLAGLLAVGAVFMLNMSVTAFFNIAKQSSSPTDLIAVTSSVIRTRVYKALIISDAILFASSSISAICCTFAGIPIMDRPARLVYLWFGGAFLQIASFAVVALFMLAAYMAFAPFDLKVTFAVCGLAVLPVSSWFIYNAYIMLLHQFAFYDRKF